MKITNTLCAIALILPLLAVSQEPERELMTISEFTVKPGEMDEFLKAVKNYKECYMENEGADRWVMWSSWQGEGIVFGVTQMYSNWASFDKTDSADAACRSIIFNEMMPHVKKIWRGVASTMPELSRKDNEEMQKGSWVTYFTINNYRLFKEVVDEVNEAIVEAEGAPRGYWMSLRGGDADDADYMISVPFSSYAQIDEWEKGDSVFKIYENKHGEEKAEEMREKWRQAVDEGWSKIWEISEELSYF